MPVGLQILDFDLKSTCLSKERWSMLISCLIASTLGFLHCKKCLTGGFSSLEISFLFPLSTALSAEAFVDNHYRRLLMPFSSERVVQPLLHFYDSLQNIHSRVCEIFLWI